MTHRHGEMITAQRQVAADFGPSRSAWAISLPLGC